MDRLARLDKDVWNSGLFLDQTGQLSLLWVDGSNVMFAEGQISVFPGSVPLFSRPKATPVTGIGQLSSIVTGVVGVCFGYKDTLYVWDATNGIQAVGSGYTSDVNQTATMPATRWSIQQWNEWIVATNGKDPMQLCKIIGTGFAAMTADTSTQFKYAQIIRKFRQFLVAFNLVLADGTTKQPNALAWCDVNDVETWVPDAANSARKLFIPDLESGILCAEKLGDNIIMYSDDSNYALEYKGYPNVFEPTPLLKGIGVYGKNCVAEVKGRHMGIGPRGIWQTDGSTFDYIDTPPLNTFLAKDLNTAQASKIVVYNDKILNHLIIFYPSGSALENDAGLAFNYLENKWTKLAFCRSAAIDSGVLPYGVTGGSNGAVYRQSQLDVPASDSVNSAVEIASSFVVKTGYGQGGYGERGYGGQIIG